MILPIMFFSSTSLAVEQDSSMNEYDSIHRYNALENKISFVDITGNADINLLEKIPENNIVEDNNAKKLKDTTKQQINSMEKSENAITSIENRGKLKTFLVGNRLGVLKYEMVQMKDQNYVLNTLALDAEDGMIKNQINNLVNVSELQQEKITKLILKQEDKFSLFGWLIASL